MAKFRKKPVVIEAERNNGSWRPIVEWLQSMAGQRLVFQPGESPPMAQNEDGSIAISTLEGVMRADVGDWIIRGVNGEFYPCKPDIFAATYTRAGAEIEDLRDEVIEQARGWATVYHYDSTAKDFGPWDQLRRAAMALAEAERIAYWDAKKETPDARE
jgi:hypothetical protein